MGKAPGKHAVVPVAGAAGIRVRMYRVGFGDFFLLTLSSGGNAAHILVDCGVHAKPTGSIGEALKDLEAETGGKLALVIVTHRHADHISGFASGAAIFSRFTVERVWMPWFENVKNPQAMRIQSDLVRIAQRLQLSLAARNDPADRQFLSMAENVTGPLDAAGVSANDRALKVIHSGFANKPPIDYVKAGDPAVLPQSLQDIGLVASILGPPIDPKLIGQMDSKNHQYLDQLDADEGRGRTEPVFASKFHSAADAYVLADRDHKALRATEKRIRDCQPDVTQAMAAKADNTLNNQSVVVLFEFNGKKLLFSGDAQWGNWQNFLFGGAFGTPGHEGLTASAKAILGSIDFYKVGHHGSTNATPIDALEAMRDGMAAMCSTAEEAYNQVPRGPLLDALKAKTGGKIARSDQVPVKGAPAIPNDPLDAAFTAPTHELFIDYHL